MIAEQAAELTVFQRTAGYSGRRPERRRSTPRRRRTIKAEYAAFRAANRESRAGSGRGTRADDVGLAEATAEERRGELRGRWERGGFAFLGAYNDLLLDRTANDHRRRLRPGQDPGQGRRTPRSPSC